MNTESLPSKAVRKITGFLFASRAVPPIPRNVRGILVVRQHDQLGDMLCVAPTLRALREAYPGASITLVASPVNYEIMRHHPRVDRVLLFDKREAASSPASLARFRSDLRATPYDLAIVPSTVSISLTSGIIARLSGARVRIGPGRLEHRENPAAFLYTHPVDLDWSATPERHQTLRNADILRPLRISVPEPFYELGLAAGEREKGERLLAGLREGLDRRRPVIGMHPGAAKPGNRWPPERFAGLARKLHDEFGCVFAVTIGPSDAGVHERLRTLLDVPHRFIAGEPIRTVAAVIDRLDAFISNDTGPLHIAGALSPPVLGLFGPTDPRVWAPPGKKNRYLAAADGRIDSLDVDGVFAVARELLEGIRRFD